MINFTVGPVMMDKKILSIGAQQIPYFRTREFSEMMLQNEYLLKKFLNASDSSRVVFLTGSGTAAMEAAVMNLFCKEDKVIVINGGSFGERFKRICDIHEIKSEDIKLNYGEPLTAKHLSAFDKKGFTGLLINAHETSTGVLYDLELVKDFCQSNNLFLVVDAISSFLADDYDMQGVNATILSSQKALALPPGISFVILDDKALTRVENNKAHSMYFNFKDYLNDGKRGQTPFTPGVGILLQLSQRLDDINKLGVKTIINNVSELAQHFRRRINGLPLEIATPYLSNAITPLRPKGKMAADKIVRYLIDNYSIFVVPNGGELSQNLFRVGHIGAITKNDNDILINALFEMFENGVL